jgi:hypothetical protein
LMQYYLQFKLHDMGQWIFQYILLLPAQSVNDLDRQCLSVGSLLSYHFIQSLISISWAEDSVSQCSCFIQYNITLQQFLILHAQHYHSMTKRKPRNHVYGYNAIKHHLCYLFVADSTKCGHSWDFMNKLHTSHSWPPTSAICPVSPRTLSISQMIILRYITSYFS